MLDYEKKVIAELKWVAGKLDKNLFSDREYDKKARFGMSSKSIIRKTGNPLGHYKKIIKFPLIKTGNIVKKKKVIASSETRDCNKCEQPYIQDEGHRLVCPSCKNMNFLHYTEGTGMMENRYSINPGRISAKGKS